MGHVFEKLMNRPFTTTWPPQGGTVERGTSPEVTHKIIGPRNLHNIVVEIILLSTTLVVEIVSGTDRSIVYLW